MTMNQKKEALETNLLQDPLHPLFPVSLLLPSSSSSSGLREEERETSPLLKDKQQKPTQDEREKAQSRSAGALPSSYSPSARPHALWAAVLLLVYTTVSGETDMANYVLSTGPLSVCLDANNWSTYTGGVMTVCGNQVDHCVQAVGVDTSSTGGYWIVRNSWGTSWVSLPLPRRGRPTFLLTFLPSPLFSLFSSLFSLLSSLFSLLSPLSSLHDKQGEDGYIYLAYGKNTCDITNDPTWTSVSLVNN